MYKYLLCWRYLKTRYLAFMCIVSVMLGVATLIVVNSVMAGFSTKLRERLHALLSDVVIESVGMEGFADPEGKMALIRNDPFLGPRVETMTATMEVFAMMQYRYPDGRIVTRPVKVIGVDPKTRGEMAGFREYLVNPKNQANPSFAVPPDVQELYKEREKFHRELAEREQRRREEEAVRKGEPPPPDLPEERVKLPQGAIIGHLIASFRYKNPNTKETEEIKTIRPGDAITLTTISGERLTPVYDTFIAVDYFKSDMSEYDNNYVFVPLDYLQHLRTMQGRVTSIQIKLKDYGKDSEEVVAALGKMFDGQALRIDTWEHKQGPLLAAIDIEKGILNILLFMIVGVAGFGILAIFSMIVSEKTRDIGILKALGASNGGVMKVFLSYGLLLGVVGAALGSLLGILITNNINWIEAQLSGATGHKMFPSDIYYFDAIPTDLQPAAVLTVNLGAIAIAIVFSILPAIRAARLHPVQALRYD